jgi:hypothetical protein
VNTLTTQEPLEITSLQSEKRATARDRRDRRHGSSAANRPDHALGREPILRDRKSLREYGALQRNDRLIAVERTSDSVGEVNGGGVVHADNLSQAESLRSDRVSPGSAKDAR